jgi:hypothetical protein
MKYWLIWLIGVVFGMGLMRVMIATDSDWLVAMRVNLGEPVAALPLILYALSCVFSVVINILIMINSIMNSWEIKID